MPIIKSAKKRVKQNLIKTKTNKKYTRAVAVAMRNLKLRKKTDINSVYSTIDKAAKKKVIHKKKANRLKSLASRLVKKTST